MPDEFNQTPHARAAHCYGCPCGLNPWWSRLLNLLLGNPVGAAERAEQRRAASITPPAEWAPPTDVDIAEPERR